MRRQFHILPNEIRHMILQNIDNFESLSSIIQVFPELKYFLPHRSYELIRGLLKDYAPCNWVCLDLFWRISTCMRSRELPQRCKFTRTSPLYFDILTSRHFRRALNHWDKNLDTALDFVHTAGKIHRLSRQVLSILIGRVDKLIPLCADHALVAYRLSRGEKIASELIARNSARDRECCASLKLSSATLPPSFHEWSRVMSMVWCIEVWFRLNNVKKFIPNEHMKLTPAGQICQEITEFWEMSVYQIEMFLSIYEIIYNLEEKSECIDSLMGDGFTQLPFSTLSQAHFKTISCQGIELMSSAQENFVREMSNVNASPLSRTTELSSNLSSVKARKRKRSLTTLNTNRKKRVLSLSEVMWNYPKLPEFYRTRKGCFAYFRLSSRFKSSFHFFNKSLKRKKAFSIRGYNDNKRGHFSMVYFSSPLGKTNFTPFRRIGFAVWDRVRLISLGVINVPRRSLFCQLPTEMQNEIREKSILSTGVWSGDTATISFEQSDAGGGGGGSGDDDDSDSSVVSAWSGFSISEPGNAILENTTTDSRVRSVNVRENCDQSSLLLRQNEENTRLKFLPAPWRHKRKNFDQVTDRWRYRSISELSYIWWGIVWGVRNSATKRGIGEYGTLHNALTFNTLVR